MKLIHLGVSTTYYCPMFFSSLFFSFLHPAQSLVISPQYIKVFCGYNTIMQNWLDVCFTLWIWKLVTFINSKIISSIIPLNIVSHYSLHFHLFRNMLQTFNPLSLNFIFDHFYAIDIYYDALFFLPKRMVVGKREHLKFFLTNRTSEI